MLLLARGLLLSFTDLINNTGYNVRIVGSAGLPLARLPVEDAGKLVDQIRGLPQVASVAMMRTEPASTAPPNTAGRARADRHDGFRRRGGLEADCGYWFEAGRRAALSGPPKRG